MLNQFKGGDAGYILPVFGKVKADIVLAKRHAEALVPNLREVASLHQDLVNSGDAVLAKAGHISAEVVSGGFEVDKKAARPTPGPHSRNDMGAHL